MKSAYILTWGLVLCQEYRCLRSVFVPLLKRVLGKEKNHD